MKTSGGGLVIRVEGLDELESKLRNIPRKAESEVEGALIEILFDLKGKSQRLAPIDVGNLKGSAFAENDGLEGTVGFQEVYAVIQHESMDFNHPKGGEAKFLENPFKENINKYIKAIGAAVKRAVER